MNRRTDRIAIDRLEAFVDRLLDGVELAPAHRAEMRTDFLAHLEADVGERVKRGKAPDAAVANALARSGTARAVPRALARSERTPFGPPPAVRRSAWLDALQLDLRLAFRLIRKDGAYSAAVLSTLAFCMLMPSSSFAQPQVEVFGALDLVVAGPRGSFTTSYVPAFLPFGPTAGEAGQTLALDASRGPGLEGGVNWLPSRHAGVQVFVSRTAHDLSGTNTPYDVQFEYTSRPPPSYEERPAAFSRSLPWPDTAGSLTVWSIGLNGLARVPGRRANLTVTGGLLLTRASGSFDAAGFHEYFLGGHSTLFEHEAAMRLAFDEAWHAGVNVGAEVAFDVARHAAIVAGLRITAVAPAPHVTASEAATGDLSLFTTTLAEIQQALDANPVRFDRWATPVVRVGVRLWSAG